MTSTDPLPSPQVGTYAVDTAALLVAADRLRASAITAAGHRTSLGRANRAVSSWSGHRSRQAATAFLATLDWAAAGAGAGLDDLARRTAAAAGAYDRTEGALPFPR